MNNKGLVFTIITLLLFFVVFSLSYSYFQRGRGTQDLIASSTSGDKIRSIEANIATDFWRIQNISLWNITKTNPGNENQSFVFFARDYRKFPRYPSIDNEMRNYTQILQNRSGSLLSTDLRIEGGKSGKEFDGNFTLMPYGTMFSSNDSALFIYTSDYEKLRIIELDISLPFILDDADVIYYNSANDTNVPHLVNITINYTGYNTITGSGWRQYKVISVEFNPNDIARPWPLLNWNNYLFFGSLAEPIASFRTQFGRIGGVGPLNAGRSGTLSIEFNSLNQDRYGLLNGIKLIYEVSNETARLQTQSIVTIDPKVGGIVKRGPITIVEEPYYG